MSEWMHITANVNQNCTWGYFYYAIHNPKSAAGTEGACTSLDKVDRMDGMVLDISGLDYGDVISWNEATVLVRERIFGAGRFDEICKDCQWFETCSREKSRRSRVEVF